MVRESQAAAWKLAFFHALIGDGEETAHHMELVADRFDQNPETKGLANLLRDRASDLRLATLRDRDFCRPVE